MSQSQSNQSKSKVTHRVTLSSYVVCEECRQGVTVACMVKHVTEPRAFNICKDCLTMVGPLQTPTETSAYNRAREWAHSA